MSVLRSRVFCRGVHCTFGWTSPRWAATVLLFAFFIGFLCFTGFNFAVRFLNIILESFEDHFCREIF
jgi:hypothetical protein